MGGYRHGDSYEHGRRNNDCGLNRDEVQHVNGHGTAFEFTVEGNADAKDILIQNEAGETTSQTVVGSAAQLGFSVGHVENFCESETLFNIHASGGSYVGGGASLYHKKVWAQSRSEKSELAGQIELSGEHRQYLTNLKDGFEISGFNPQLSTTEAQLGMGLQYNYKHQLYIDGNVGAKYMHNVDKSGETSTVFDGGAATFTAGVKYVPKLPQGTNCNPYFYAKGGCDLPVLQVKDGVHFGVGKPMPSVQFGLGIAF